LRILNRIERIVDHVYIYPDYNGNDWTGIVARYRAEVEAGIDTDQFYLEMHFMINELGDDHSSYISPIEMQQFEAERKGDVQYVGVGIYSEADFERKRLIVISTYPGSPAEHAGIRSHDSILFVDGFSITPEGKVRMNGPKCSAVVLTVQSPDESPRDVLLIRSPIDGNIPIDARLVSTTDGARIGYIFIPSFLDETLPPQIQKALQEFGPLDGLVLDLRTNGGGSSTVTFPILSFFVDGRLGSFVGREEKHELSIDANPIQNSQTVPLVVMVSKATTSFAEIFAGLLRDVRGAKIVGETSLGNVEILHGYDFEDGSVMWIASEKFDSDFSDDDWEKTGIIPDMQAPAAWDSFDFDTDPAMTAALKLLGHQ